MTNIQLQIAGSSFSTASITDNLQLGFVLFTSASDLIVADVSNPDVPIVYGEVLPTISTFAIVDLGSTATLALNPQRVGTTIYSQASGLMFSDFTDGGGAPSNPITAAPFIGTGFYPLAFQTSDTSSCGPFGSTCLISNAASAATVEVTYIYAGAPPPPPPPPPGLPEPATIFTSITGIVTVVALACRSMRK